MDLDKFIDTYCLYCGTQQCDPTDPEWLAGCRHMRKILEMKKESIQMNETLNLSPPWDIFEHEIEALFGQDPEITIKYDRTNFTIKLFVDNTVKAEALTKLLPVEKFLGNVKIHIEVIPANDGESQLDLYKAAFQDNPIFRFADSIDGAGFKRDYVIFNKEVVQFFCDNLSDYFGAWSTLYENIARDVFGNQGGICFCTDIEEKAF